MKILKYLKKWLSDLDEIHLGLILLGILLGILIVLGIVCLYAESVTCAKYFPSISKTVCIFSDKYRVVVQ